MSKALLPAFGGSAAVWTMCLVFFQSALVVGYAYAHLVKRFVPARYQAALHLATIGAATMSFSGEALVSVSRSEHLAPASDVLLHLLTAIGAPYIALAATSSLVQLFWSRAIRFGSPYPLYAVSNFLSLAGLISYPLLLERYLDQSQQAAGWVSGWMIYALVMGVLAVIQLSIVTTTGEPERSSKATGIVLGDRLLWTVLPAVSSALLVSVTNQLGHEFSSIPLVWVGTLALYLGSYIVTFASPRAYDRRVFIVLFCLLLIAMASFAGDGDYSVSWGILAWSALLLVGCMICHGELVAIKPPADCLTSFYLLSAIGGSVGGLVAGIGAPLVFTSYAELPLALQLIFYVVLVLMVRSDERLLGSKAAQSFTIGGMTVLFAGIVVFTELVDRALQGVESQRNFFGSTRIALDGQSKKMIHGGTVHGLQLLDETERSIPTTYYGPESGAGLALTNHASGKKRHVGAVGLGIGTIAAYGKADDEFDFFEINPQVIDLARRHFSFISSSLARVRVIEEDGRLGIAASPLAIYDVLVLDAFNGGAIPVHLLTLEAFRIYLAALKQDGVIAINISNNHIDLAPVMSFIASEHRLSAVIVRSGSSSPGAYPAAWCLLSRESSVIDSIAREAPDILPVSSIPPVPWSDSRSSIVPLIRLFG